MCKFCINGIGNIGDISCGDLWKTDVDGCPIFTESNGQNIVIARTDQGKKLLMDAQRSGYLVCTPYSDLNALTKIQSNHSTKRSTILGKYYGCKIMHKPFPEYNVKGMRDLCKSTSRIKLLKTVLGTIKRIRKGKI